MAGIRRTLPMRHTRASVEWTLMNHGKCGAELGHANYGHFPRVGSVGWIASLHGDCLQMRRSTAREAKVKRTEVTATIAVAGPPYKIIAPNAALMFA